MLAVTKEPCMQRHKPTWPCGRAACRGWLASAGPSPLEPASRAAFCGEACLGYLQISSQDSVTMARRLALEEGLLAGISCSRPGPPQSVAQAGPQGQLIVTILPSFGERQLSSALFGGLRKQAEGMTAAVAP